MCNNKLQPIRLGPGQSTPCIPARRIRWDEARHPCDRTHPTLSKAPHACKVLQSRYWRCRNAQGRQRIFAMLSGRTTLQAAACGAAPPLLNSAQTSRNAHQTRFRCFAAARPVDGGASSVAAAAASCPYSAAKAALQQLIPQQQLQQQQWGAAQEDGFVQTPGPHPLSLESVGMVTTIFTEV